MADDWQTFETFNDEASAEALAGRLRLEDVPAEVRRARLVPGVEEFRIVVPADLVHRARWVMADATLTDAELTYLATGELGTEGNTSAYRDALSISADSSDQRLELAAEILASGAGVVMFNDTVALRPTRTCLLCEVVDPAPSSRRCENEFEVLVENARTMLDSSRLRQLLPNIPRKWLVVEDYGTGTAELWRAP